MEPGPLVCLWSWRRMAPPRENALPSLTVQGLCRFDALNDFNRHGGSPCWRFTGQLAL